MMCNDTGKVTGCRLGSLLRRFQEGVLVCGGNGNGVVAGLESVIPMPRILVHLEQNQPNSRQCNRRQGSRVSVNGQLEHLTPRWIVWVGGGGGAFETPRVLKITQSVSGEFRNQTIYHT
jgi:hypothetical protein